MPTDPNDTRTETEPSAVPVAALVAIADASVDAGVRVWGLTAAERLARGLERTGIKSVANDTSAISTKGYRVDDRLLLVRSDYFYDERLLQALSTASVGTLLRLEAEDRTLAAIVNARDLAAGEAVLRGEASPDGPTCTPGDLVSSYDARLRKHQPPFALRASSENVRSVENEIFAASYKGITDLVTKWVWPVPARAVVRVCARHGITPNMVTYVSYVLAIAVIGLWAQGWFWTGLALGWAMTFLDTVDGKLARCTLTSTPLGNVLDHGLDLVHPPIWWAAWAWGLAAGDAAQGGSTAGAFGDYAGAVAIIVAGYIVGRLLEGVFMLWFKMDMFTWRPFDALFRQVIARRNPNLLLLTGGLLLGSTDFGLLAIAAWTLGSIAIQVVRIAQAARAKAAGKPIRSWYEERAELEHSQSAEPAGPV